MDSLASEAISILLIVQSSSEYSITLCVRRADEKKARKALEEEFADEFVRIHRSVLVALQQIERLEKTADGKTQVVLRDELAGADEALTISRRHVADVRRRLKGS